MMVNRNSYTQTQTQTQKKKTKKEITLIKIPDRKYITNELEPHDYCIEISYHWTSTVCDYFWEIYYSNDREKWGEKQYQRAAESSPKCYKTPQECIPDIQKKILPVFGEHVKISLSEKQLTFKKGPSKIKEVLFKKDSDTGFDTYWYRDQNAFFISIDYYYGANAYVWEICYSENRMRWGGKYNSLAARSWKKTYKTPQECIPDIERHVLLLSWGKENIKISLE
jgi:hypothetical protein